jgi:integrase/recombinase XerD
MTDLHAAAEQYLATRRAVGFKLTRVEGLLFNFVEFLRSHAAARVTCELALRWATLPSDASPVWWKSRLCVARCFARYLASLDPLTEVPPTDLLPRVVGGADRVIPYPYSDSEIAALLAAARSIRSPLTAATCETILGLLVVTGMRVGETLRLDLDDLDVDRGVLIVRDSKFNRSREVPLHQSALAALRRYGQVRDEHHPVPRSPSLFVSRTGGRLSYRTVNWHFDRLVRAAGLQPRSTRCRPRLHDLRHRFACTTIEEWHRDGVDVHSRLPLLSTYLGHIDPNSTYWYLSGQPHLLAAAARRLEASLQEAPR